MMLVYSVASAWFFANAIEVCSIWSTDSVRPPLSLIITKIISQGRRTNHVTEFLSCMRYFIDCNIRLKSLDCNYIRRSGVVESAHDVIISDITFSFWKFNFSPELWVKTKLVTSEAKFLHFRHSRLLDFSSSKLQTFRITALVQLLIRMKLRVPICGWSNCWISGEMRYQQMAVINNRHLLSGQSPPSSANVFWLWPSSDTCEHIIIIHHTSVAFNKD